VGLGGGEEGGEDGAGRPADASYHIRGGRGREGRANMSLYQTAFMYMQFSLPSLFLLSPFCCSSLSRYEKVPYGTKQLEVNKYVSCFLNFQKASLMRCVAAISHKGENIGELTFTGYISTEFLCSPRCFLRVHCVNS
jgi:hypothetical protein